MDLKLAEKSRKGEKMTREEVIEYLGQRKKDEEEWAKAETYTLEQVLRDSLEKLEKARLNGQWYNAPDIYKELWHKIADYLMFEPLLGGGVSANSVAEVMVKNMEE